jgi:hypothetical protein
MSCSLRGVECEGYVLRWIDATARGTLAAKTYTAPDRDTDLHLALELRAPIKANITRADEVENSSHSNHQVKVVSEAEPIVIHEHVNVPECFSGHNAKFRAISILRQQSWSILRVEGAASDDLGGFVTYCTVLHIRTECN